MATSYANSDGSGDRRTSILTVLQNMGAITATPIMIDGAQADTFFWGASSTVILEYWFTSLKLIDEAKWYQDNSSSHGTFKWQGSNDRSTWTDVGSTFTLGGSSTQTQTQLNGNTTPYIHYRLLQTAGTTSGSPWLREVEFKIDEAGTTTYAHAQGKGDRTGTITQSSSGAGFSGTENHLINGAFANDLSWSNADVTGDWVRWDFGATVTLQQARWFQSTTNTHGIWKWQGSADGSSWSDVGGSFTLGTGSTATVWPSGGGATDVSVMGDLTANVTGYRYYRILGVSGAASGSPSLHEVEFMLADGGGVGGGVSIPVFMHHYQQQGMA